MENRHLVDQKGIAARRRVLDFIAANRELLAAQGSVVACWREHRGRHLGPYFRLALRVGGRQRSVYLGADGGFVGEVRVLLADLQSPVRKCRALSRQRQLVKRSLALQRQQWRAELGKVGLHLQGNEVRGMRGLFRNQRPPKR